MSSAACCAAQSTVVSVVAAAASAAMLLYVCESVARGATATGLFAAQISDRLLCFTDHDRQIARLPPHPSRASNVVALTRIVWARATFPAGGEGAVAQQICRYADHVKTRRRMKRKRCVNAPFPAKRILLFQQVLDRSFDHIYREISDLTGDHRLGASDPYLAVSVSTLTLSETVILL